MPAKARQVTSELQIKNTLGLHTRPASLFVQTATAFDAEIMVEKDGKTVNGKSLMGLLMLAAGCGATIKIQAKGTDGHNAIKALEELINRKFDEE